jgi:phosphoserine phosphatase
MQFHVVEYRPPVRREPGRSAPVDSAAMEAILDIPPTSLPDRRAHVGAFFDLDGTLVQGFTAAVHLGHRIRHRQARIGELTGTVEAALRYRFGRMKFEHLLSRAGGYLRGESLAELHDLGGQLYTQRIESWYQEMRDIVAAHRQAATRW